MRPTGRQDELYGDAVGQYGAAIGRLARGYEADPDRRRDLMQEIHVAIWRSFHGFSGDCSLRTWVYRVAHNIGASHILRARRARQGGWISLDDDLPDEAASPETQTHDHRALERLTHLIQQLRPPDRQVMLLYLDKVDAAGIADITGLTPSHVATKIHRIKARLTRLFHQGAAS